MSHPGRLLRVAAAICALALATVPGAPAQDAFPSKPVRIVVPYTPGGASDITARLIAEDLKDLLKTPVLVDNVAGASGMIGTRQVATAAPDGHTLALVASSHVVNKALFPKEIGYDPLADFAPVILTANVQLALAIPAQLPAKTLPEFLDYARKQPEKLSYASSGKGSNPHLFAAQLLEAAKLDMIHVPYRGSTAAHADLLAGRTQMMFDAYAALAPHVQAGRLRLLAVAGATRFSQLPDVPTVAEAGFPDYGATSWGGIIAPKGTPAPIVARLNHDIDAILAKPHVKARLAALGAETAGGTSQAFAALMRSESARYAAIVDKLGLAE